MQKVTISSIFSGVKTPLETYIPREKGKFETELKQGLLEDGVLCLLTGSSKTGKTSLYNKVLSDLDKIPIRVRCSNSLTSDEFWNYPLEHLDFSRLKSNEADRSNGSKIVGSVSGSLGWAWLAGFTGSLSAEKNSSTSEKKIQESILAKPSPTHLVPLLKNSNAVLVVEDFHYLSDNVQKEVFQQWKIFTDNEISVIVVGTTHHGVDLAVANSDLIGRIKHVDLKRWSDEDLSSIAITGLKLLNFSNNTFVSQLIAKESAGLPIITQQICAQLFTDRGVVSWDTATPIAFTTAETQKALYNVANTRYKNFEHWHSQLVNGPRKAARKYDTYAIILALFVQDPPTFSLTRTELDKRLKNANLEPEYTPPPASINSTLSSLAKFQESRNFRLLEWSKSDRTVYILEPSFLFYLRWYQNKKSPLTSIFEHVLLILQAAYTSTTAPKKD